MRNKFKLVFISSLANTFEWYDYALFGHFAAIIGKQFFPATDDKTQLLYAFMAFALGYLMRPLGGMFFGTIGDRFGRKTALSLALMCMSVPTMVIAFLPNYEAIGIYATLLMLLMRMIQGLSMGGALTGSVSFIIEHTNKSSRGFLSSFSMASICIGILLGSLAAYITKSSFSQEQFEAFGWRIPFFMGMLILFVGQYIRKNVSETPLYKKLQTTHKVESSPLSYVLKHHKRDMLTSICINSIGSVIFYLQAIYAINYFNLNRDFDENITAYALNFCYILMAFTAVFSGWLSDKVGRVKVLFVVTAATLTTIPFILYSFAHGGIVVAVVAQVILAILAASFIGPEPALQAELYPTKVRNTALSLAYNVATSVFGGTAPLIFEFFVHSSSGGMTYASLYVTACCALTLLGLMQYQNKVHIYASPRELD